MLNLLTDSVFTQTNLTISSWTILASLLTSLFLGLVLASLYKYRTAYSKEFVQTLTVLPSLIAVIIFLVNGNLGTSVAVAGTFSLIKFRSPAASAKELLLVFMATAIGLATGMGYLVLAVVVTFLVAGVLILLEHASFAQGQTNQRQLSLSLPVVDSDEEGLVSILDACCQKAVLLNLSTKKNQLDLLYHVEIRVSDQELCHRILTRFPAASLSLIQGPGKKKRL